MEFDEFLKLVRQRRSVRQFKPDPVPDEYIEKILETARWAMSGANAQPWEFIVVKDQETKNKMAASWAEARVESYVIEQTRIEELRHHQLRSFPKEPPGFKNAPVIIVVCGDKRTFQATVLASNFISGEGGPAGTYVKNMGNATLLIHLAVAALGLGSQWCSVNHLWEQSLKAILDVPHVLDIHTIVPIGYPVHKAQPPYRRKLDEIVHYEKYDRSRYRSGDDIIKFLYTLRGRTKAAYEQERSRD